jgi:integrase/recombinase XerD
MKLTKGIKLFCDNLDVMGKSPETISNYSYYLSCFSKFLSQKYNRELYIDEIKSEDLDIYVYTKLGEKRYSASTRHGMVIAFKSMYSFLYKRGYCEINIGKLVKGVKVNIKERDYITEIEFRKIEKEIVNPTIHAVICTLFYTGLRITECINLKLEDIDFINEIITVKSGKGNKDRNIPLNNRLKKILMEYLKNGRQNIGTDYFFASKSGSVTKQYANRILKQSVQTVGIQKTVSCHVLRHSMASNLVDRGVNIFNIQKLLGHSSIKTTAIYLHTSLSELQDAVNTL